MRRFFSATSALAAVSSNSAVIRQQRWCKATPAEEAKQPAAEGDATAAAAPENAEQESVQLKDKKGRYHPRWYKIISRELIEEQRRRDRVPQPPVPKGWQYRHEPGDHFFTLRKRIQLEDGKIEELRLFHRLELKDYEVTYRIADGERDEHPHFTFSLYIFKPESKDFTGGVEFTLTAIENEMVVDACAVHSTYDDLKAAWSKNPTAEKKMNSLYRGPSINELDDEFADELINYLDDRGINNAFAEYITAQSVHAEDENYQHWLRLMRQWGSKEKVM